mgnify:CR=1 FL=1
MRTHDCGHGTPGRAPVYGERMSAQQQRTSSRSEDALPTGGMLLPLLQLLALACMMIHGLYCFREAPSTGVAVAVAYLFLSAICAVGALWIVRRRLEAGWGRAACSVTVMPLVAGLSMVGTLGFSTPALIVATALLVVDIGVRTSLAGDVLVSAVLLPVLPLAVGLSWKETLYEAFTFMVLMSVGTALGLVLSRYDAALAAQRRAITERDAALENVQREAALEKELMLAQERERAAHELHDGLGHRLTQIRMSLEFAGRVRDSDPDAAWEEVAVAEHYLRHVCRAARSGYVHALYQLSFVFEYGDYGAAKDAALARRLMGICARKQHPNAIFHAAWQARDEAEHRRLILLAARKRSQAAYLYLADCHAKGRDGFRQNRRLATFYKKRAWADGTWTV